MSFKKIVSCLLIIFVCLFAVSCTLDSSNPTITTAKEKVLTTVMDTLAPTVRTATEIKSETETTTKIESGEVEQSQSKHEAKDTATYISSTETTETSVSSEDNQPATVNSSRTIIDFSSLIDKGLNPLSIPETTKEVHGNEFFNDAVFIGDSVTLGLKNYVTRERNAGRECLGKAQFLCAGSMSYTNSRGPVGAKNTIHPKYKGKEVTIEDGVKQCGAKKVFIMLGMNDFAGYSHNTVVKNARDTFDKIIKKNPDVAIYVESVTPITENKEHGNFTNENVDKFNEELKKICDEYGFTYVDIASVMKDDNNCLKKEYCSDINAMGIHMNNKSCKIWVDYLLNTF